MKCLKVYLEPIFIEWSSNSDVEVFPLTKIMDMLEFPLFEFNEAMEVIVQKYEKVNNITQNLEQAVEKCNNLLDKEII
ncbi:hypothetical protein BACCIP111883_01258 [Sutcliffiella rhizosphaerae]|uniref:Uncharacterized protein n=1 Tax=Sutcliffiella rhizosphaerae TaxID=2880967 RepID=A0ABN8A617_9BACI|nr:hypothetical protein BACCIP111883_01258 [Sutcliffiella rhizosphaerae]